MLIVSKYFNPRTREGCDKSLQMLLWSRENFNPRTREGCDRETWHLLRQLQHFNPRTREGCDGQSVKIDTLTYIFQSTHPRRVRRITRLSSTIDLTISIHAPAKGATVFFSHYLLLNNTANHFFKSFVSFFPHFL